ncbi:MAG: efflux RND transporter permease subunit [Gemmatimonadales bacterium]
MQKIAEDRVVPYLGALTGISSVSVNGGARNGVVVAYDADRLQQLGIDPALLTSAVSNAKISQPVGEITSGPSVLSVSVRDQPRAIEDLGKLPIRGRGGIVYPLGQLAFITPEEDNQGRAFRLNGKTAVGISLQREAGADAIKTAAAARAVISSLAKTLPPGVRLTIARDESEDLSKQLNDLMLRGAIAFGAGLPRADRDDALDARRDPRPGQRGGGDRRDGARALPLQDPRQHAHPRRAGDGDRHPGAERPGGGRAIARMSRTPPTRAPRPARRSRPRCSARR